MTLDRPDRPDRPGAARPWYLPLGSIRLALSNEVQVPRWDLQTADHPRPVAALEGVTATVTGRVYPDHLPRLQYVTNRQGLLHSYQLLPVCAGETDYRAKCAQSKAVIWSV
jgi:hypothetical protein